MRIEEIRLRWFRGTADEAAVLRTEGKSLVVYGPNASGKSCFTDSLEYVLREGRMRIGHLAHEYSGYRQEKGIRNTHTPEGAITQIEIAFEGERLLRADIQPNGSLTVSGDPQDTLDVLAAWEPDELILRQDGLAEFINKDKAEKYSALLPLLGLEPLEVAAENMRHLQRQARQRSNLDAIRARADEMRAKTEETFGSATEAAASSTLAPVWERYLDHEKPPDLLSLARALQNEVSSRIENAEPDHKLHVLLESINGADLDQKLTAAVSTRQQANELVDELLDTRIPILQGAETFLRLIPPEQRQVSCPACGLDVGVDAFRKHVQDELSALSDARSARGAAENARTSFVASLGNVQRQLREQPVADWAATAASEAVRGVLGADPAALLGSTEVEPLRRLQPHVDSMQSAIAEKVRSAPPATADLISDRDKVARAIEVRELIGLEDSCSRIESVLNALESCEQALRNGIALRTGEVLGEISNDVQALWAILHPDEQITDIHLYISPETDKGIDVALTFHGKEQPSPRLTLSEGYRNSLGLCIFLALLLREGREHWPLVLDDVVSSFDREHRGLLVDVLLRHFSPRQVVLFTHDREWFAELRRRLPEGQWRFVRLGNWAGPAAGLRLLDAADTFEEALELLPASPASAAGRARAIMDRELPSVAERLRLLMPYLSGDRNDQRTAAEFLTRLISQAPRRFERKEQSNWVALDEPVALWQDTHTLLIAWANPQTHGAVGAIEECKRLIESCRSSLEAFRCSECHHHVWERNDERRERLYCPGDHLRWKYG